MLGRHPRVPNAKQAETFHKARTSPNLRSEECACYDISGTIAAIKVLAWMTHTLKRLTIDLMAAWTACCMTSPSPLAFARVGPLRTDSDGQLSMPAPGRCLPSPCADPPKRPTLRPGIAHPPTNRSLFSAHGGPQRQAETLCPTFAGGHASSNTVPDRPSRDELFSSGTGWTNHRPSRAVH